MNSNGHQTMDEEAAVSIAAMSKEFMDSSRSSDNNNTVDYRTTGEREIRLLRAQATNNQQQSQNNTMSRVISYEKENQHNSVHTAAVDQQQPNNASKSPTSRGLFRNGAAFASIEIPPPEERNSSSSEEMVHEDNDKLQGVRLSYFDEENSSNNNNIMAGVSRVDNPGISNNNQYSRYEEEEENEYDDCSSDASGQTVVHNDCPVPPVNATQEEINKFYWIWCYGKINDDSDDSSNAAVKGNNNMLKNGGLGIRTAPAKSCLSTKKKDSNVGANRPSTESISPRRLLQNSPPETNDNDISFTSATDQQQQINEDGKFDSPEQEDLTPKNNITRLGASTTDLVNKRRSQSAVKFGTNTAAEFDFLRPITEMTPIPLSVVQEIFPTDVKEEPEEKEIEHRQTAQNVATLAEWEDDFDDIISEDNDAAKPGGRSMKRGLKRTPHKRPRKRRESSSSRRRESSIFSRERRSLIDPDDSMEMDDDLSGDTRNNNAAAGGSRRNSRDGGLPFSVTCDPEDYTSPSAGSVSTMGTPAGLAATKSNKTDTNVENNAAQAKQDSTVNRDSLDSACISPNSLKSSLVAEVNCNNDSSMVDSSFESVDHSTAMAGIMPGDTSFESIDDNGRDSNGTNITAKATPNSARTSSSTILRAVHASGALLPGNNYSHSPHHQSNHNVAPSTSANNGGSGDVGNGRLRPNHLRYSPSSSSGASSTCPGRMDASPSDSYSSLGSDIMSLFTHHSIDDTKASPNNSPLHLSKQLSVLSAHPIMPYHTNISDLIQLSQSNTQYEKVPLTFMNEHLMRGVSPPTSLALIVHDMTNGNSETNQSMFCGKSEWLSLALSSHKTKSRLAEASFESMLMHEVKEMTANRITPTHSKSSSTMTDVDLHTIASCIQQFHTTSCLDWSSMETDVAIRTLSKSQEWAETMNNKTDEYHKFVASCCKKLAETSAFATAQLTKPDTTRLKLQKCKVQSQVESEISIVKNLENQLAVEVDRLQQAKRVKRLFDAHLNIERHSPILALTEEIRTVVTPTPIAVNASDFTFSLLDGAAEIVMKIELDDDEVDNAMTEIGCFIKDGGASIQLLQAILMGNLHQKVDDNLGPYPLRASLSKMILESESREELFLQMSHIVSRIDTLVRSVRVIETSKGFCVVNAAKDGNVTLSVSMGLEGHEVVVVNTTFLFSKLLGEDWCVTTVPDSVNVSVLSPVEGEDLSSISNQLQEKAQSILHRGSSGSNCDPILLRRMCSESMICR